MVAERIDVGVDQNPAPPLGPPLFHPDLEQVERPFSLADQREAAGGVVANSIVVRIDRECARKPFPGLVLLAQQSERARAELGRTRAFRMLAERVFCQLEAEPEIMFRFLAFRPSIRNGVCAISRAWGSSGCTSWARMNSSAARSASP